MKHNNEPIILDVPVEKKERVTKEDGDVLSFWVSKADKKKYATLQSETGGGFGESLKAGVLRAIDEAAKKVS